MTSVCIIDWAPELERGRMKAHIKNAKEAGLTVLQSSEKWDWILVHIGGREHADLETALNGASTAAKSRVVWYSGGGNRTNAASMVYRPVPAEDPITATEFHELSAWIMAQSSTKAPPCITGRERSYLRALWLLCVGARLLGFRTPDDYWWLLRPLASAPTLLALQKEIDDLANPAMSTAIAQSIAAVESQLAPDSEIPNAQGLIGDLEGKLAPFGTSAA